jgi:hypothetical protein
MEPEKRHAPRYQFIAEAEVTEILSDTSLRAKTSDLSIDGCFLDMLNTSPEGIEVRVRISHKGTMFTTLGKVVFAQPNLGMGVVFKSVQDNQLVILQEWISKLSGAE